MAARKAWGIDIGRSSLKAVCMAGAGGDLEIQAFEYIPFDRNEDGVFPPGEATHALEELLERHPGIRKDSVFVAVPGHNAFSRVIRIPGGGSAADQEKMIGYEARQQIPNVDDVRWGYALLTIDDDEGECEVGLFAVKRETVDDMVIDLAAVDIEPAGLTIGPVATYNFLAFDEAVGSDGDVVVVLDIGWDHTDLVLIDGGRFWLRNLRVSGKDITQAIATKLRLPFEAAEMLKQDVAAGESKAQAKKVYKATELVLRDFVAQVYHSVGFYKSQHRDRRVEIGEVVLVGGGSRLPNLEPFFQKELKCPVRRLEGLQALTLGQVDVEDEYLLGENLPAFASAFGLAIQGCGEAQAAVNLLPEDLLQRKALAKKKPLVAVGVALLYVAVLLAWMFASGDSKQIKSVSGKARAAVQWINDNTAKLDEFRGRAELESEVQGLVALVEGRTHVLTLVNRLAAVLPANGAALPTPSDAQRKVLEQYGRQRDKVDEVRGELAAATEELSNNKTWLLETKIETNRHRAKAVLTVARNYVRDQQGGVLQEATLQALDDALLSRMREVLPSAKFDGTPWQVFGLRAEATKAPTTGFGAAASYGREYLAQRIVVTYPAEPAEGSSTDQPVR